MAARTQTSFYHKIQNVYGFTDQEIRRMQYTLSVIGYEGSKLIVFGLLFGILGLFMEYLVTLAVLLPIRIFAGGLHFNHYSSCFLFTAFFLVCPLALRHIMPPDGIQIALLAACMLTTLAIGPIPSIKRPPFSYRRYTQFRLIAGGVIAIYLFIFAVIREFPGKNICFWVILLQTIQLICAKLVRKGDTIYEKAQ